MSEAIRSMGEFEFSALLRSVLVERRTEAPAGLEQRLLARLAQDVASERPRAVALSFFGLAERMRSQRSSGSIGFAIGVHAVVLGVIFAMAYAQWKKSLPVLGDKMVFIPQTVVPMILPRATRSGGGGGRHDDGPVAQGRLPRVAKEQIVPLKAPPMESPKLAVEQTLDVQKDLKMATNTLPNFGMPNSSNKGISMGNGMGTGIGSGNGSGLGRGSGGNTGGGLYHLGSGVQAPTVLVESEAEFSEEARKAKFSGSVEVYLWVEADGTPSHVRVVRGVGMGLDEKAVEAVRKYKFRPATKDGKPVAVDLYIDVNFEIM
jgi:protein TonB